MKKQLLCGAAKSKITPGSELFPNLYGLMCRSFGGILDDLNVRVLAVGNEEQTVLVIAYELDKAPYPKEAFAEITARTGIPERNILLFAIHTHTAPLTGDRPEEGPNRKETKSPEVQAATNRYEGFLKEKLLDTVDRALACMQPARMGSSNGKSYINVNRNQDYTVIGKDGSERVVCSIGVNPEGPVDHTLFTMKFEDLEGNPIAFFINYPVHNVVMHANNCYNGKMAISSDLGGAVSRYMEQKFDGSVAIWSSGAAGDINPIMMNQADYPDPVTGEPREEGSQHGDTLLLKTLAARHFSDILTVVKDIVCSKETADIASTVEWSYTPGRRIANTPEGLQIETGEGVDPYDIRLQLIRIGDVALYGVGGELYTSFAQTIKQIAPLKNTVVINHAASMMCHCNYIIDDDGIRRGAMSSARSRILPGYVDKSLRMHTQEMFSKIL